MGRHYKPNLLAKMQVTYMESQWDVNSNVVIASAKLWEFLLGLISTSNLLANDDDDNIAKLAWENQFSSLICIC